MVDAGELGLGLDFLRHGLNDRTATLCYTLCKDTKSRRVTLEVSHLYVDNSPHTFLSRITVFHLDLD